MLKPFTIIQEGEIEEWKKDISAAAKFPNVFVKLSGMIIEADPWSVDVFQPYVNHCIQEFGIER
jgi:L-fuconolactonase